jgi:hypothetical protein
VALGSLYEGTCALLLPARANSVDQGRLSSEMAIKSIQEAGLRGRDLQPAFEIGSHFACHRQPSIQAVVTRLTEDGAVVCELCGFKSKARLCDLAAVGSLYNETEEVSSSFAPVNTTRELSTEPALKRGILTATYVMIPSTNAFACLIRDVTVS